MGVMLIVLLAAAAAFGVLYGAILTGKNRNERDVEAAAVSGDDETECPYCAEIIKRRAIKCRFCGSELPDLGLKS